MTQNKSGIHSKYIEELPDQCPPTLAKDIAIHRAYRIIPDSTPALDHFKSYAALKEKRPEAVDECLWASCSLRCTREQAANLAKLPNWRNKVSYIATLSIKVGSGKSLINRRNTHIDFWMYSHFDPLQALVGTPEKIDVP